MASLFILYHYTPSLAGVIIFVILFTILYYVRFCRFRARHMIPIFVGGVCISHSLLHSSIVENIAYFCHAISHFSPQSSIPYFVTSVLALAAPALFSARIYMILGRTIQLLRAEHHCFTLVNKSRKKGLSSSISYHSKSKAQALDCRPERRKGFSIRARSLSSRHQSCRSSSSACSSLLQLYSTIER